MSFINAGIGVSNKPLEYWNTRPLSPQSLGVIWKHVLLDIDIVQNTGINLLSLEEFPYSLRSDIIWKRK